MSVRPVLEVLQSVGMLDDDRPAPLEAFFRRHTAAMPPQVADEVRQWFCALRDGSTRPPRSHPIPLPTIRQRLPAACTAVTSWTAQGITSLREIQRHDILAVLSTDPQRRQTQLVALRGLFRFLKARRIVFTNPTTRIRNVMPPPTPLLPIDLDLVRTALNSTNPAASAITALIAYHGLRNSQVRALRLTDLQDGRLHLRDRSVLLARPVRERLRHWLDERTYRWPATANPYLFITTRTAVRTTQVSATWISTDLKIPAQAIRQDRILHEALATHGDVRLLCDMFGISIATAERYALITDPPPPTSRTTSSGTPGIT
jgi:site-specific recombinase XerD